MDQQQRCGTENIMIRRSHISPVLATGPMLPEEDSVTLQPIKLSPQRISFLNWNLYKGNGANWQSDFVRFAREHDVLAIQEARLDAALHALLDDAGHNWSMNTAFYLKGHAAGVMTTSSATANDSCGFRVSEPVIRVPKSALVSYYAIEGHDERLLVANIHSINFTLGMKSYRAQLQQLYDAISHHDGPMIVAGDFNSWSDRRMRAVEQLVQRLDLADIEYRQPHRTQVFGYEIDHVFYRQLEVVDNRVWPVTSSDHNPISVHFRYQPVTSVPVSSVAAHSILTDQTR